MAESTLIMIFKSVFFSVFKLSKKGINTRKSPNQKANWKTSWNTPFSIKGKTFVKSEFNEPKMRDMTNPSKINGTKNSQVLANAFTPWRETNITTSKMGREKEYQLKFVYRFSFK